MAFSSRTRLVNPRLGSYFAIFAAAFAALVVVALVFEQLGTADHLVRLLMFTGPILLYGAIGLSCPAQDAADYFACGRRVPAFFNGLVLGITALGGAGFLALTGCLFMIGFDALSLCIGFYAGLVFMTLLFTPFLRKFGGYTLPTFLGRRFESRTVRVVAAGVLALPILLLLMAEARFAAYATAWLLGQSERLMVLLCVACAGSIVALGGMRSLSWAGAAKAIAAMLALAVPATIIAVMLSNLPLPQMTHGNAARVLARLELVRNVPIIVAPTLAVDLPGEGVEPLAKRFIQAFGSVGSLGFVLLSLVVAAGIAASPILLARAGTTPGVYETRKSGGWGVLVVGLVLLTLPAVAVYLRLLIAEQVVGSAGDRLPIWFQVLQQAGIARIASKEHVVTLASIAFERDAALFALSIAAGLPQAIVYLSLAGALAAALAGLAGCLLAGASMLSEDVMGGLMDDPPPERARLGTARTALLATALVGALLAAAAPADPLQLFLWAMAFSAAAGFPVLLLAIWWKRMTGRGALAGMVAGTSACALLLLLCETGALPLPGATAGLVGMLAALAAAGFATVTGPIPSRLALEVLNEVRVPGGETLYDREMRLARLKNRAA